LYEFETSSAFIGDSHRRSMMMVDVVIVVVVASAFFLVIVIIRQQGQDPCTNELHPPLAIDVVIVSHKRVIVDPKDAW